MTDEHLSELGGLTPFPAPPRLRAGVLAEVDRQLTESGFDLSGAVAGSSDNDVLLPGATAGVPNPKVLIPGATAGLSSSVFPASSCPKSNSAGLSLVNLSAWTVAASLLVGIGLCGWQQRVDARLEALYGPSPVSADIADLIRSVESVSGPGSGSWIAERLLASKSQRVRRNNLPQEPAITTFHLSSVP